MSAKVVIITGASSGFGEQTAQIAASRGYRVVVTARREERLRALVERIQAAGGTALAVSGDVTSAADQQQLIERTLAEFGRIDVLVNNAGVPLPKSFVESTVEELRRQWETNVLSVVELTRRALPALIDAGGVVINVGSTAGHFSVPGWGLYFPTKVAVASVNDALRRELVPLGVRVCLVEPGPYNTEFAQRAGMQPDPNVSFGFPPSQVAEAIVRLIERPRRLTIKPTWMTPLILLGGGLTRLLPGVVDLILWAVARRRQRQAAQTTQGV